MTHHVLVLDSNTAVQAIITAALQDANISVRTSAGNVIEEVRRVRPLAIMADSESAEEDAFDLCRTLKKDPELKSIFFILLAPGTQKAALTPAARQAGVDSLLFKPFKSDQVRTVVLPLIEQSRQGSGTQLHSKPVPRPQPRPSSYPNNSSVALVINEAYLSALLESTLERLGVTVERFTTIAELEAAAPELKAVFVEATTEAEGLIRNPNRYGTLVRVGATPSTSQDGVVHLPSSFSVNDLIEKLGGLLSFSADSILRDEEPLDQGRQTLLAAKISSVVYEKLLTQEALRHRKWEEACSMIGAEALRICRNYRDS